MLSPSGQRTETNTHDKTLRRCVMWVVSAAWAASVFGVEQEPIRCVACALGDYMCGSSTSTHCHCSVCRSNRSSRSIEDLASALACAPWGVAGVCIHGRTHQFGVGVCTPCSSLGNAGQRRPGACDARSTNQSPLPSRSPCSESGACGLAGAPLASWVASDHALDQSHSPPDAGAFVPWIAQPSCDTALSRRPCRACP